MKENGFTLAEVLITLGIIGVVAAMTLPALIQNYKEQETVTRVKKFYSVFSQAYTMAILEHGTIDNWGLSDSTFEEDENGNSIYSEDALAQSDKFISIMKPYLKNIRDEKISDQSTGKSKGYVLADGTSIVGVYLNVSNCKDDKSNCGDFYIVTNGGDLYSDKASKTIGKYGFSFILRKNRIEPSGASASVFENSCLTGKRYSNCTAWVILNGNMDYLHCKDLEWGGKTKCD